jgi:ribose 5-phosphate isomerase B
LKAAIGSDHLGYQMKEAIKKYIIEELGFEIVDYGCKDEGAVDYPLIAEKLARGVAKGKVERGILICGTGIGMAIVANKVKGVRAAQCYDVLAAQRARWANNAQIMTLGAMITGVELGKIFTKTFLTTEFSGIDLIAAKNQQVLAIEERFGRE